MGMVPASGIGAFELPSRHLGSQGFSICAKMMFLPKV